MTLQTDISSTEQTDFSLSVDQMVFMMNAISAIEQAEAEGNEQFSVDLVASPEYQALFDTMSIDQAIDRYELTLAG